MARPVEDRDRDVGRVLAAEAHPNADRLSVCTVDTGDGERTIVCGAPNVQQGKLYPFARSGTTLPGGPATLALRTGDRDPRVAGTIVGVTSAAQLALADDSSLEVKPNTMVRFLIDGAGERNHASSA